jgi:hypothetical protein
MRKVIYHLEPALPQVKKKFPSINFGGCGVFANLLANELDKLGVKYKIVWIGSHRRHKKIIKQTFNHYGGLVTLNEFNEQEVFLAHVMIKIGKTYIDASGVYNSFKETQWSYRCVICDITKEQLEFITLTSIGWNTSFNRNQIPRVEKEVKKIFEKIAI